VSAKRAKGAGSLGSATGRTGRRGASDQGSGGAAASSASGEESHLPWGRKNFLLLAVGLGLIVVGFLLLALGDTTFAPVLLVGGFLGLIPWGIVAGTRRDPTG